MSEGGDWVLLAILFGAACGYGEMANESSESPCVYHHNWVIDRIYNNDAKRTCVAFKNEANARIGAQQVQMKEMADQIDRLNSQLAERERNSNPQLEQPPEIGAAPTLTTDVGSDLAHSSDDDDDD